MSEDISKNSGDTKQKSKVLVRKRVGSNYGSYGNYGGYGGYGNYGGYGSYGNYGGYGGGYGGYGAGASMGGGASAIPNRTFKDYLAILRERIWYIIITFIVIFAGVMLYTARVTPTYMSAARIQVLRDPDKSIPVAGAENSRNEAIMNVEDFNTQVKILESSEIIRLVQSRMKEDEKKALMQPYQDVFTLGPKLTEEEIIGRSRNIIPERLSLIINITFEHPDSRIAAQMANLFAQEYISFNQNVRVQKLLESRDELMHKVSQQEEKVKALDKRLVDYREKYGAISLEMNEDIDRRELVELNSIVTNNKRLFDACQTNWVQVQEYKAENKNLYDLPFISEIPIVSKLLLDKSQQQITISALEKRYKEKHPKMIEARKVMDQIDKELAAALDSSAAKVKSNYETAKENYERSLKHLADKKKAVLELGKVAITYNSLERERDVEKGIHSALITSMTVKTAQISLISPTAQIIDRAVPSIRRYSPNYVMNTIIGLLGGILGGLGMAFAVAFLDDRVKSAYDVEYIIGLPLLGVIPRIKRLNSSEKAQIVASNADRGVTEAFRSLYSAIGVTPMGKNAKLLLSTSTTPSEGKSFVMTNLAFISAMNGEKVVIVDADLRLPSIAKTLGVKPEKGILSCIENGVPLKDAIVRDVFPNVDVLFCERRAANPTQILNSQAFMGIIEQLKAEYDKVFVDSPPVGVVSDVLSIFPLVDSVMYVVKFNSVKRSLVKMHIKKMLEANVPLLGVVMNMVNMSNSAYYSTSYYNKQYQNYYISGSDESESQKNMPDVDQKDGDANA